MEYTHKPIISCYDTDTVPAQIHEPAGHFEYEVILVTGGGVTASIAQHTYRLSRGSLVFIGRLESHSLLVRSVPYTRYVSILSLDMLLEAIRDNRLLSIFIRRPENFRHVIQLDEDTYRAVLPMFEQFTREYRDQQPFYLSKCASLLNLFLIELYRRVPSAFPEWSGSSTQTAVVAAQRYMTENFRRPLTLDEVAAHTFVSRHTMSVAFRETVGMTFKNYLILLRITEAKRLLLTTDDPVSRVGELVGYTNVNNFIQIFRDRVGTTPLQYRLDQSRHDPMVSE